MTLIRSDNVAFGMKRGACDKPDCEAGGGCMKGWGVNDEFIFSGNCITLLLTWIEASDSRARFVHVR